MVLCFSNFFSVVLSDEARKKKYIYFCRNFFCLVISIQLINLSHALRIKRDLIFLFY
jgi:hypothetical protein